MAERMEAAVQLAVAPSIDR